MEPKWSPRGCRGHPMCLKVAPQKPPFGLQAHQGGKGPPFQLKNVGQMRSKGLPGGEMDLFFTLAKLTMASRYVNCYIFWNFILQMGGFPLSFYCNQRHVS